MIIHYKRMFSAPFLPAMSNCDPMSEQYWTDTQIIAGHNENASSCWRGSGNGGGSEGEEQHALDNFCGLGCVMDAGNS